VRDAAADPWRVSVVVLLIGAAAGFAAMVLGWRGVAARTDVAEQVPYLVSGAFAGVGLLGLALGLLVIQARRRAEALRRRDLERVRVAVTELAASVRGETAGAR
jgi:hypothetical protein